MRDEEELRNSEPLANVSWRGLFSAFYSLSDVLLVNLTALERKWQKSSFCLSLANSQVGQRDAELQINKQVSEDTGVELNKVRGRL